MEKMIIEAINALSKSLGRLEGSFDGLRTDITEMREDMKQIKSQCIKLPDIEIGLHNHLKHHDSRLRYFWYPSLVIGSAAIVGFLLRVIFHVI